MNLWCHTKYKKVLSQFQQLRCIETIKMAKYSVLTAGIRYEAVYFVIFLCVTIILFLFPCFVSLIYPLLFRIIFLLFSRALSCMLFPPLFVTDMFACLLVLSVALFHVELCLSDVSFFVFFLSLFLLFLRLSTYSMNS